MHWLKEIKRQATLSNRLPCISMCGERIDHEQHTDDLDQVDCLQCVEAMCSKSDEVLATVEKARAETEAFLHRWIIHRHRLRRSERVQRAETAKNIGKFMEPVRSPPDSSSEAPPLSSCCRSSESSEGLQPGQNADGSYPAGHPLSDSSVSAGSPAQSQRSTKSIGEVLDQYEPGLSREGLAKQLAGDIPPEFWKNLSLEDLQSIQLEINSTSSSPADLLEPEPEEPFETKPPICVSCQKTMGPDQQYIQPPGFPSIACLCLPCRDEHQQRNHRTTGVQR